MEKKAVPINARLLLTLLTIFLFIVEFKANSFKQDIYSQWNIKHITVDDGLSNNYVHSICQDRDGYMWFATSNGLNRYDGINIDKFLSNRNDSTSIQSNYVSCLCTDADSVLWVGTDRGLQIYNDTLEIFQNITIPDGLKWREVYCITKDKAGDLIIGTSHGLYVSKRSSRILTEIVFKDQAVRNDSVYRMVVDEKNNLWFTRFKKGLYYYDRSNHTIKSYRAQPSNANSLPEDWISALYIDSVEHKLWVGTYNSGFCKYNPSTSSFTRYYINPNDEFTKRIRTIFEDRYGRLFLGSREGLYLFDRQTEQSTLYALKSHKVSALSQNSITYSYKDNQGGIWMGSHSGGVNYMDMYEKEFSHYQYAEGDRRFLNTGAVHCFAETDSKLYVGTEKGLSILNKKTGIFSYLSNVPGDWYSLSYNDVKQIAVESEKRIWVATNRGGVQLLDDNDKVIKSYRYNAGKEGSIPSDNVYNIFEDYDHQLWVITNKDWDREKSVLSRLNKQTNTFISYPKDFFMGIYQASDSTLLFGGYYGFYEYNKERNDFIAYENDSLVLRTSCLCRDKNKNVWLGSRRGLTKYNAETGTFEDFSKYINVSFEEVYGLLENDGNLWVSTNNGLIEIQNIYSNNNAYTIRYFDKNDGLQSREFNYNAFYKGLDGSFYFGGDNGFNRFFPDEIMSTPFDPQVHITSLYIDGKRVFPQDTIGSKVYLHKSIKYTSCIQQNYKQGTLSLKFSAIHYSNSQANKYKYMLVGQDKDWLYSGVYSNEVTYHKLAPGSYTFKVYAINADGIESKTPAVIDIKILPPFWQRMWFRVSLLIWLSFIVYLIIHMRTAYLRRQRFILIEKVKEKAGELATSYTLLKQRQEEILNKNEEITVQRDTINQKNKLLEEQNEILENHRFHLEELVSQRTRALEQEKMKAVESDHLKSAFLANMSHEIRTPLNAIIGFSNILASQNTNEEHQSYFEIIKKSSFSLLKLIEDIIDFSRIESGTIDIHAEPVNISQTLNNQYESFLLTLNESNQENSQQVNLILENKVQPPESGFCTDTTRLDQILSNLISNAIKFTHSGYVKFGLLSADAQILTFYVEDTGIGIEKDDFDYIFKRFRKLEHKTEKLYRGGGLGLSITENLVSLLGGKIWIESELYKGTIFYFTLKQMSLKAPEIVQKSSGQSNTLKIENWENYTVLVVEDEFSNYKVLQTILQKTQIRILYAADSIDAISLFEKHRNEIDLVLMDIKLPKTNGMELSEMMKEHRPELPIIAQTAYATELDKKKINDSVMDDYVTKPIIEEELLMKMHKFLTIDK